MAVTFLCSVFLLSVGLHKPSGKYQFNPTVRVLSPRNKNKALMVDGSNSPNTGIHHGVMPPSPIPANDQPTRFQAGARDIWLSDWASKDFSSALSWARQQTPELRDWALGRLSMLLAETNPQAALAFCEKEELTTRLVSTTAAVLQMYAAASPRAAYDWVANLPTGELSQQCAPRLFATLAVLTPELAGKIVEQAENPAEENAGIDDLIELWTRLAPEVAANWLIKKNQALWQASALDTLVIRWAQDDTAGAQNWIEKMSDGALKRQARLVFDLHRNRGPAAPESGY